MAWGEKHLQIHGLLNRQAAVLFQVAVISECLGDG